MGEEDTLGRGSKGRRLRRWLAFVFLVLGILMVSASGAYLFLASRAGSELKELKALAAQSVSPQELQTVELAPGVAVLQSSLRNAFPGSQTDPIFWDFPMWARELAYDKTQAQGFSSVDWNNLPLPGTSPLAVRIRIPAIGVDASVKDLAIRDLGDSRAYETPKNMVGHIPSTTRPGELGNGWYFGHLESYIRGEGSVFRSLPNIPSLLRQGQAVYIIVDSASGRYLYQVTGSDVVYQDDLYLYSSDAPEITLVTCVPSFKYDHRLLVTAKLVGIQ